MSESDKLAPLGLAGLSAAASASPETKGDALIFSPRHLQSQAPKLSPLSVLALRFHPGQELVGELVNAVRAAKLRAAFVLTCVGSCVSATIRLANADLDTPNPIINLTQRFEILSLVGTISPDGPHLHISLGDSEGRVIGGHLIKLEIFTTAEIVVGECTGYTFARPTDPETGWDELTVSPRQ